MAERQRSFKPKTTRVYAVFIATIHSPHPIPLVYSAMRTHSLVYILFLLLFDGNQRKKAKFQHIPTNSVLVQHRAKRREKPQKGKRGPKETEVTTRISRTAPI